MEQHAADSPRRRPLRATVVATLACAALALLVVVLAGSLGDPPDARPVPTTSAKPHTPVPDSREDEAQALYGQAQLAADRSDWAAVKRDLEALRENYADTRFCTANREALARLLAEALAHLEPPDPPAGDPGHAAPLLREALDAWPVVFEDPLTQKSCLKRALLFKGQYDGHFDIRGALVISGVHTISAAWWNQPVGDSFALSVDLRAVGGFPHLWLCGPGYGTSTGLGYHIRIMAEDNQLRLRLARHGASLTAPAHDAPLDRGEWYHLDVLRHGGLLAVHINGQRAGQWRDPVPLRGPMHAFVALGALQGHFGNDGVWYRNLAIRVPQPEAERLAAHPVERILDPPLTALPQPNGDLLLCDEFGTGVLSRWAGAEARWGVHERKEGLVLHGPNCWPAPWRREPLAGRFALEIEMSYFPNGEAINFYTRLRLGDFIERKNQRFQGWTLGFTQGDGLVFLNWHDERGDGRRAAQTSYFAPVAGRPYVLRLERSGRRLRVFANGGFLLEAHAPVLVPEGRPVYLGLRQIYGGSRVRRITAWRLSPADTAPPPGRPVVDFGPRLAAAANFFAAFHADVRPLLADRRYGPAAQALAALGRRPDLALAAPQLELARVDLARLTALWATVRRTLGPKGLDDVTAADLIDRLGPAFPQDDRARLQAALLLLVDKRGDKPRASKLLSLIPNNPDARRYRAMAER